MAYSLIVFRNSGDVGQIHEIAAGNDHDAIVQIGGIDLPHGAELRRGRTVVAKFGCWRITHDAPDADATFLTKAS